VISKKRTGDTERRGNGATTKRFTRFTASPALRFTLWFLNTLRWRQILKLSRMPLTLILGMGLLAMGFFLCEKMTVISLKNMDRPGPDYLFRPNPDNGFSIFYLNSIYLEPASEDFRIEDEIITLIAVRTKSPAVMEYYGFTDMKEYHALKVKLGTVLFLRRGTGDEQGIDVGGKKFYFKEMTEIGDRMELRVKASYRGLYLLQTIRDSVNSKIPFTAESAEDAE